MSETTHDLTQRAAEMIKAHAPLVDLTNNPVSSTCASGEHGWCMNRSPQEANCGCGCHVKAHENSLHGRTQALLSDLSAALVQAEQREAELQEKLARVVDSQYAAPLATAGECWIRQLRAAGWLPVNARTLKEVPGSTTWRSPGGSLYRGPYRAWTVLKYQECIRTHSKTCLCGSIALRRSAREESERG